MYLIKEDYHTGDNHGALYHVCEDFDMNGKSLGLVANFMGNVICKNLEAYLAENPDIQVIEKNHV